MNLGCPGVHRIDAVRAVTFLFLADVFNTLPMAGPNWKWSFRCSWYRRLRPMVVKYVITARSKKAKAE
jgi:hypothetical protein